MPGTLLYIKSSLTGDEPADVLRYAAEHPAFPHESTNDQFFDESQFESYRALGYHARTRSRASLRRGCAPRTMAAGAAEPVEIFTLLRQRWGKPAPAPPDAVQQVFGGARPHLDHGAHHRRTCDFLDEQMFPEMPALIGLPSEALPSAACRRRRARLPRELLAAARRRRAPRRASTSASQMLQLMEDVFLDFDLDQYHDHIDNRGWMNLFQHWAWSGMLCATWAMTGSTFDPRFQRFCWTRLDLRPGAPSVARLQEAVQLPDPAQWRRGAAAASTPTLELKRAGRAGRTTAG